MVLRHFFSVSVLLMIYSSATLGFPGTSSFRGSPCFRVKLPSNKCFQKSCFTASYTTDLALHYRIKTDDINDLLLNARECAYSSSCSLEEAEAYLAAVSGLQKRGLTGHHRSISVFEDPFHLYYLVQQLKEKIHL